MDTPNTANCAGAMYPHSRRSRGECLLSLRQKRLTRFHERVGIGDGVGNDAQSLYGWNDELVDSSTHSVNVNFRGIGVREEVGGQSA